MKKIDTVVEDINHVIKTGEGWSIANSNRLSERINTISNSRLGPFREDRKPGLRMSNMGELCKRKLYLDNQPDSEGEDFPPSTLLKFFYGDMLEALLIELCIAAGHHVAGEQEDIYVGGVPGHRDLVLDGVTTDVKSASGRGFDKFKNHALREDDPFGYLPQLSGYIAGSRYDPLVLDKIGGAFLVINKETGQICLDYYDLSDYVVDFEDFVEERKRIVESSLLPEGLEPEVEVKSKKETGNLKLPVKCQEYCQYRDFCWEEKTRKFGYSTGQVWYTHVEKEPRVGEINE